MTIGWRLAALLFALAISLCACAASPASQSHRHDGFYGGVSVGPSP